VHIKTAETALLFTGDAENEDKTCTPELSALADKYNKTLLLNAEVYHVAHHGSFNGTTPEFMKLVTPRIAVISAGDPLRKGPGQFHAPQFGHPREIAVTMVTDSVTGTRSDFGETHKSVTIFSKVQTPKTISMDKALYCTCWDGDVKVRYKQGETTPTITMTNFRPNVH